MCLKFSKMHGLGNDFVVIDGIKQDINFSAEQIRALADRRLGVGFDQLLVVEKSSHPEADFDYRIFNADGSEVEHCGNGARCFARFVHQQGLSDKQQIPINTKAGRLVLHMEDDGQVTVAMGVPNFEPDSLPFKADRRHTHYPLSVAGQSCAIGAVSLGNPHAVLDVDDVDKADVDGLGASIERHSRFPQRVNVGFRQIVTPEHIRLRVFERGVGETLACGTGACAAVVVGIAQGLLADRVRVGLPGGDLWVHWPQVGKHVMMTGPVQSVFSGQINWPQ